MENFITPAIRARLDARFLDALPPQTAPVVYAMAGIPGAGKSTFVDRAIVAGTFPHDAFILNPDRLMEALDEYHADVNSMGAAAAFARWELPVRMLAYDMAHEAARRRLAIIKDMGMVRPENWTMLQDWREMGYQVELHVIYCPVSVALAGMAGRTRHFPPGQVTQRAADLQALLAQYRHIPHQIFLYQRGENDNSHLMPTPQMKAQ